MTSKSWLRTVDWAVRGLLLVVAAFILSAIAVLVVLPKATHGSALTVLTGSMTPKLPVGSVVLVRPVDPGTLKVGDVATYQKEPGKPEFITHRIIKIDTTKSPVQFIFKGDANRGEDIKPVAAGAIRGKVWFHVPYLGAIRDAMHTRGGLSGLAMLLLAGYALVQFAGWLRERRGAVVVAAEPESEGAPQAPPAAVVEAPVARELLVATLRTDAFDGLQPATVVRLLNGILLDANDTTFSLLIGEPADRMERTVELLRQFEALEIRTSLEAPSAAAAEPARA